MNPRSIHFRLMAYHGSLIALTLVVFASTSYWGFRRLLIGNLEVECASQTKQIADSLLAGLPVSGVSHVQDEIEEHYTPEGNNLFIRIVGSDDKTLYQSGDPRDRSFRPPQLGFLAGLSEPLAQVDVWEHRLVFVRPYTLDNGEKYQIQMVASLSPLERSLAGLWRIGMFVLPFALIASIVGGFFLTKRSLNPVREIVATARTISSSNLKERLVESPTDDEIQQLTRTLNQMFERLEASFGQMIRFTADASHELRTPLTVMRGNLELVLRNQAGTPEKFPPEIIKEMLVQTLEETERLSRIVGQLMELTQLDSGEIELEQEVFDLNDLAATTVEQMRLLADDKQIQLEMDLRDQISFRGDRHRIKQVLLNLIDNAIKHCPSCSHVWVRLFRDQRNSVLEVTDDGPGIPASAIASLWQRFYRIDKARSRELGGSGLGLSICKAICEAHGGKVEVQSEPGKGSVFRVRLPLNTSRSLSFQVPEGSKSAIGRDSQQVDPLADEVTR